VNIYHLTFSWEVDRENGTNILVYPTRRKAEEEARRLLQEQAQEEIEGAVEYNNDPPTDTLTVDLDLIEVVPITRESLCAILNSQGGSYLRDSARIGTFTLQMPAAKIKFKRSSHDGHDG